MRPFYFFRTLAVLLSLRAHAEVTTKEWSNQHGSGTVTTNKTSDPRFGPIQPPRTFEGRSSSWTKGNKTVRTGEQRTNGRRWFQERTETTTQDGATREVKQLQFSFGTSTTTTTTDKTGATKIDRVSNNRSQRTRTTETMVEKPDGSFHSRSLTVGPSQEYEHTVSMDAQRTRVEIATVKYQGKDGITRTAQQVGGLWMLEGTDPTAPGRFRIDSPQEMERLRGWVAIHQKPAIVEDRNGNVLQRIDPDETRRP